MHVQLFSERSFTLIGMMYNPRALLVHGSIAVEDHRPFLVSGGGFDTLVGCFDWLHRSYHARVAGHEVYSHARGVTFDYGQSTARIETTMAQRQLDFLNAGLAAIAARAPGDTSPLTFELDFGAPGPTIRHVQDTALRDDLARANHPITWNTIVPHTVLPCNNAHVVGRNAYFLSAAHRYADADGANTLLFGAQGSGPDVSLPWAEAMLQVLYHGNESAPLALHTPAIGTLKSVGFSAIREAGGADLIQHLGFSCQTDNDWTPRQDGVVPTHCGVCFRCDINALNLKRAWLLNPLAVLDAAGVEAQLHKDPVA